MQSKVDVFVFFYVPGSCGHFLAALFNYYINPTHTPRNKSKSFVNVETGDCHNTRPFGLLTHWKEKIPAGKKVIAIDFDEEDKKFIFRMMFHKAWKKIFTQKMLLDWHNGKYKHLDASNLVQLESQMSKNLDDFIFNDWKLQLKEVNPLLTVTYKEIVFGDINRIVADFFNVDTLLDAEEFVKEFRLYNSKYFVD